MKKLTKYTFEAGEGRSKLTAVISASTKETAIEKLCQELGVRELPVDWRLTKYDIK
jgi:ribosomal protein L20A (L18A)